MGTFFRGDRCARNRDHEAMMMVDGRTVNARGRCSSVQKKAGPERARLKVWPREADTITFQEGLLSARATGGGGTNAQRERSGCCHYGLCLRHAATIRAACQSCAN